MTIHLREATPEDAGGLAHVCRLAGGGAFEYLYDGLQTGHDAQTILTALAARKNTPYSYHRFTVAESDGEFAGAANAISIPDLVSAEPHVLPTLYNELGMNRIAVLRATLRRMRLGLRIRGRQPDADTLILANVAVFPEHTGQGIGAALVQHILDRAAVERYPSVSLVVWDANTRAHALYERMGFEQIYTAPFKPLPRMPYRARGLMVAKTTSPE